MSRELKFRAWFTESQIMYSWEDLINRVGISESTFIETELWKPMQYIGKKDKTGVEIYEGDICNIHIFTQELGENMGVMEGEREFVAEICFDCICGLSVKNSKGDSGPLYMYNGFEDSEEQIEVIGNIHTTPQLLEDE